MKQQQLHHPLLFHDLCFYLQKIMFLVDDVFFSLTISCGEMIHHEINLGSVKIRIKVDGAKVAQIVQWRQILYQCAFQMQQGKVIACLLYTSRCV